MHIFNVNNRPNLIITNNELLFRDNILDEQMHRHTLEQIEEISVEHRYDADKELFIWIKIQMLDSQTPFLIQISSLDTPTDEVISILRKELKDSIKLRLPTDDWLANVKSGNSKRKFFLTSALIIIAGIFILHKFVTPTLDGLPEDALNKQYEKNIGLCSAKAKIALQSPQQNSVIIKKYCGAFGLWHEAEEKSIPAKYLTTEFSPLTISEYLINAKDEYENKNYEKATSSLESVIYLDPKNDKAYMILGQMQYANLDKKSAFESIQKAIDLNPDSDINHNAMSLLYSQEQEYEKALVYANKSVKLKPSARGFVTLAAIEDKLGKADLAIDHYKRSLYEDANNTAVLTNLGLLYWDKFEYKKASEVFEKAYKSDPTNPVTFLNYYELSLVEKAGLNEKDEQAFTELFKDDKNTLITYEMLRILNLSIQNKDFLPSLKEWDENYSGTKLKWSFKQISSWLEHSSLPEDEKAKVKRTIGFFIAYQQVYNLEHQESLAQEIEIN